MMKNKKRFVGATPFSKENKEVFFGRENDVKKLSQLIKNEQIVLLYAKTGLGKSSLINAGLLPFFEIKNAFRNIQIRFGSFNERSLTPINSVLNAFPQNKSFLDSIYKDDNSLWYRLKSNQIETGNSDFLIIFDQFEELFSYPDEFIFTFKKQMADLLYSVIPQNYRKILTIKEEKEGLVLTEVEKKLLYSPLKIKILISIREDRYSLLNQLTDFLPNITQNYYSLAPLTKEEAKRAIENPASRISDDFKYKEFKIDKIVLENIIQYLTSGDSKIETIQLQIICQKLESLDKRLITEDDTPNFNDVFLRFYNESIDLLSYEIRSNAKEFVEDKLIKDGFRISVDSISCNPLERRFLDQLVNVHLLRTEKNSIGNLTYELCHDTMIEPLTKAKEQRLYSKDLEDKIEKQRQVELTWNFEKEKKEKELEEKRKQNIKKNNALVSYQNKIMVAFFGVAILFVLFIYNGYTIYHFNKLKENSVKLDDENKELKEIIKNLNIKIDTLTKIKEIQILEHKNKINETHFSNSNIIESLKFFINTITLNDTIAIKNKDSLFKYLNINRPNK